MKNRKYIILAAVLTVVIIALVCILKNNFMSADNVFSGSRVRNPDRYFLDFEYMNQEDTAEMVLEANDILTAKWDITKGKVEISITDEDGDNIYRTNDATTADFDVTIPKSGRYILTVNAKKAKGYVEIFKSGANE